MHSRLVLLLALLAGFAAFADEPQGDFAELPPGKAVLRLSTSPTGLHGESFQWGPKLPGPIDFTRRDGTWWARGLAAGVAFTLRSTDGWKSLELDTLVGADTPKPLVVQTQRFSRVSSTEATARINAQEQAELRKNFTREALGEMRMMLSGLRSLAERQPPSADAATIRKFWSVEGAPAPVPDASWVAGRNFAYRAEVKIVNRRPLFTVRGEGQTPPTKGLACSLTSEPPGAEMQCTGL